ANLLTVFVLCGLWHGASWTFVVWGLWHGAFQILERLGFDRLLARVPRALRHGYALLVVMLGWVLFRAATFGHALAVFRRLFADPTAPVMSGQSLWLHLDNGVALALVLGFVGATPLVPRLWAW